MATLINVSPRSDFWHRLCRTQPLRAISEIVWNALDADADNVSVKLRLNSLGVLDEIIIKDDGSGIPIVHNEEHKFAALGGSWKARVQRTETKRLMHGKYGEGRFRAFALGGHVSWDTTFQEGKTMYSYGISGTIEKPGQFVVSDKRESPKAKTGTTVSIRNPEKIEAALGSDAFHEHMARIFAPYLLNYRGIVLKINDRTIDTDEIVSNRAEFDLDPVRLNDGTIIQAKVEVVEWKSIGGRALYLCNEDGFALSERSPDIRAPGFNFGAYIKSDYFSQLDAGALIDLDLSEGMGHLLNSARAKLAQYFKQRGREKTKALIQTWKEEGIYPYSDAIKSKTNERSQQVFDICAVTVHDYVEGFNDQHKTAKSLSFRLLKEAIEQGSPELSRILSEVLILPQAKKKEFSDLLDKANLTNILDAVNDVVRRLSVASGLRALVCGSEIRDSIKEREHIHRIVEANPWLLGEQYAQGRSEIGLTIMLREHLKQTKRDVRIVEPVLKAGGKSGRIDIMLSKLVKRSGRADDNHLVVELKRANRKLQQKDFIQIFEYAQAVIQDARFDKTLVSWDFWLIGVETDEALNELCNSQDRPPGCAHIFRTGRAKIWVKTWGELIHDCLSRHEYVREKLELEVNEGDSVAYLRDLYIKVVTPD
ncbi:ATP-binding protein [Methylobacterium bullatum]|uniref:DNA mismatch repair protein MutL n=1 Tax=Methylobacterium bullatum TaxID=570505 RepID=A0A679K2M2_9HYPH|nr:hypothetical protein MBLL_04487 [Methylobacterium bullatum]